MATLAADLPRIYTLGKHNDLPVIATDIIYEGAAVGIVKASGHARPLVGGDAFAGFCFAKADNATGTAAAINCRVRTSGTVVLAVSGAVITDVGQPVYATDDNTFVFLPTGGTFIGLVKRFVSSGVVVVEFDAGCSADPYAGRVAETLSDSTKTLDLEDSGKAIFCTATTVITLPDTSVNLDVLLVNMGPYGTVQISVANATDDKIVGPDFTGTDNTNYLNTLATAQRGDLLGLKGGHTNGFIVFKKRGTWASA